MQMPRGVHENAEKKKTLEMYISRKMHDALGNCAALFSAGCIHFFFVFYSPIFVNKRVRARMCRITPVITRD